MTSAPSEKDPNNLEAAPIIGIDFGAAFCSVGVYVDDHVQILVDNEGRRTFPTVVTWDEQGEAVVGYEAIAQAIANPDQIAVHVKSLISNELTGTNQKANVGVDVIDKNEKPSTGISVVIRDEQKHFSLEEVVAMLLRKVKQLAEARLYCEIKKAVIAVPLQFNYRQREVMKTGGSLAELNISYVRNDPFAVAIAYDQMAKHLLEERKFLVIDCGGANFRATAMTFEEEVYEVKSQSSTTGGGVDIDELIADHVAREYKAKIGIDIRQRKGLFQTLLVEAERAKRKLSVEAEAQIAIPPYKDGDKEIHPLPALLNRGSLEKLIGDILRDLLTSVETVLKDAYFSKKSLQDIIVAGGSSHIPAVQQCIRECFRDEIDRVRFLSDPEEAVVSGIAIHAHKLSCVKPLSFEELIFSGCMFNIFALSMGIKTVSGAITTVIRRNTTIPTKKSVMLTTSYDNQSNMEITIFQGERPWAKCNHFLVAVELTGIRPAHRGVPQIQVTLDMDYYEQLTISVEEVGTDNVVSCVVGRNENCLSARLIEQHINDVEKHTEEDTAIRERIDACTSVDEYLATCRAVNGYLHADDDQNTKSPSVYFAEVVN